MSHGRFAVRFGENNRIRGRAVVRLQASQRSREADAMDRAVIVAGIFAVFGLFLIGSGCFLYWKDRRRWKQ